MFYAASVLQPLYTGENSGESGPMHKGAWIPSVKTEKEGQMDIQLGTPKLKSTATCCIYLPPELGQVFLKQLTER